MSLIKGITSLDTQSICLLRAERLYWERIKCAQATSRLRSRFTCNTWCRYCVFSAWEERLPGKQCLHNLYKYLFLSYPSPFGVITYSQVKRRTPTHLWNARSAFLCRTSCIPRSEAEKGFHWSVAWKTREFGTNSTLIPKTPHPLDYKQRVLGAYVLRPVPGTIEDRTQSPGQPKALGLIGHSLEGCWGDSVSWMLPQA